ncbi:MAG: CDP-alcohol phosphatidyltransferase family protein [Paracoccus sp. (in: a-proteobacteria)]|nr:CDP-alcohol phosphatidyltransferase family protein [Paracoccus sp. (in: a-proteobacteria)]
MAETPGRRPLASRQTAWAGRIARRLAATQITPNQISIAGMVAAGLGGAALWGAGGADGAWRAVLLLAAAGFIQIRLLCNLFDGMVAIEAGRASPDGGFWNEAPDRVSDGLILIGAALGAGVPGLGWAAVSFAFLTAYIRELGANLGQGVDFAGPMAKQHRMALMTGAAVFAAIWSVRGDPGMVIRAALWVVTLGAALTAARRSLRLLHRLRGGAG